MTEPASRHIVFTDTVANTITATCDGYGRVLAVTDVTGGTWTKQLPETEAVSHAVFIDADGPVVTAACDAHGRILAVTDSAGNTWRKQQPQEAEAVSCAAILPLEHAWCPHCGVVGGHRGDCDYEKFKPKDDAHCVWSADERNGSYDTSCGNKFQFTADGPEENGMVYCCYCGRILGTVGQPPADDAVARGLGDSTE